MLKHLAKVFASWRRSVSGASTIEFAFVAPLMVMLVAVGTDVGRYVYETEQVSRVAASLAQVMTSQSAVNTSTQQIQLTGTQLQFIHDSTMLTFPDVLQDAASKGIAWSNDINITMSSVNFVVTPAGCTSNCAYVPKLAWTGGSVARPCTPAGAAPSMTQMGSDTSPPAANLLPPDVYPPNSGANAVSPTGNIIVVDVTYNFTPLITGGQWNNGYFAVPTIPITRSVYMSPRYAPQIYYVLDGTGSQHFANNCP